MLLLDKSLSNGNSKLLFSARVSQFRNNCIVPVRGTGNNSMTLLLATGTELLSSEKSLKNLDYKGISDFSLCGFSSLLGV